MKKTNHLRKLRKAVGKVQDARRFEHTLGVEYTSAALAMRYGGDLENARVAGLLHDCAKCLSNEKMLSICKKNHIPVTEVERKNPFLLHAKVGACLARGHGELAPPAGQRDTCINLCQLAFTDCLDSGHSDSEKSLPATKSP